MKKYEQECFEYWIPSGEDKCKMRDSYVVGEFGDSDSWQGVFRMEPFREASFFEFWRGNYATGVRGIIDPFDPDNPYGPKSAADLGDVKPKQRTNSQNKNASQIS